MKDMNEGDTRSVSKPCWQCKSKEQKVVKFGSGKFATHGVAWLEKSTSILRERGFLRD